jgi:hypothetical protein
MVNSSLVGLFNNMLKLKFLFMLFFFAISIIFENKLAHYVKEVNIYYLQLLFEIILNVVIF